jgi:hypothetical protein
MPLIKAGLLVKSVPLLWFSKGMNTPVEKLTELFIANSPKIFS